MKFNVQGLNIHSIYEGIGRYAQLVEQVIGTKNMVSYVLDKRKRGQIFIGNVINGTNLPFTSGWYLNVKFASFFLNQRLDKNSLIHSMSPILVPKECNIVTIHDLDYLLNFKNKISHKLMEKSLNYAVENKKILTVSKQSERSLTEYGAQNVKRIDLCALPVFQKLAVSKEQLRKKYNIPLDKTVILTVGHGKTDLVDEAVKKTGHFHVHVGRGKADINIIRPSNTDLNEIYNCSDLFIRITEVEGFGSPAMEASTIGIPIVVSDLQTYHDIYDDSAIYAEPNVESIYNSIIEGLNGRSDLTSKFDKIRQHYSFDRFKDEMNEYYKRNYESN